MFSFKLITRFWNRRLPPTSAKMTGNCCQALWLFPVIGWEFNLILILFILIIIEECLNIQSACLCHYHVSQKRMNGLPLYRSVKSQGPEGTGRPSWPGPASRDALPRRPRSPIPRWPSGNSEGGCSLGVTSGPWWPRHGPGRALTHSGAFLQCHRPGPAQRGAARNGSRQRSRSSGEGQGREEVWVDPRNPS